jgi:2'-5' RNA ligase
VAALAAIGQEKLTGIQGLHFTPQEWLHVTTFVPGLAEEFTSSNIEAMITHARRLLSENPSIEITLSKILYHPEAITVGAGPAGALDPLRKAIWQATIATTGRNEKLGPWIPHITLAYSTTDQPASPIINALGRELPACDVTINSVCLVEQQGAERLWNWRILAEIQFGDAA